MKLGPRRAHHYAHRGGAVCSLKGSESARHYNTKQLLAWKLRTVDALEVVTRCSWAAPRAPCTTDLKSTVANGWDEVAVEVLINPLRPDILLTKAGAAVLAIEVRATHAVPDSKAAQLSEFGVPWIEVEAGEECDRWKPETPLPAIRVESDSVPRLCADHAQLPQARAISPARTGVRPARASSNDGDLDQNGERWRSRVVDCYPSRGPRIRKVFSVYSKELNSHTVRLRLVDDYSEDLTVVAEVVTGERSNESLWEVHYQLQRLLTQWFELFDSPGGWFDSRELPDNPAKLYSATVMPVKYRRAPGGAWEVRG